jgi:predicted secreted Zn-dependent protease
LAHPDLSHATWRKSTYSGQNGNCVEVASNLPDMIAIRDSKQPSASALLVASEAWQTFIEGVRAIQLT